jgi:hypothetical protein
MVIAPPEKYVRPYYRGQERRTFGRNSCRSRQLSTCPAIGGEGSDQKKVSGPKANEVVNSALARSIVIVAILWLIA